MLWSGVITISGRWNGHRVLFYFSLSSGLLHRTSSHMRCIWYLPMFLFRDGLLTLMYRGSYVMLCYVVGVLASHFTLFRAQMGYLHFFSAW